MPKNNVTVELDFDRLPDADARDLARQMLEGIGFNVTKVAVKTEAGRVKDFVPKAYAPGWTVKIGDRVYVVWDQAPNHKGKSIDLWVTPVGRESDDATVYRWTGGSYVERYHGDGPCRNRANFTGCEHKSHALEAVAS